MSVMSFFPAGLVPRPLQRDVLLQLEREWDNYDVFSLTLPTAAGKTEIAETISRWQVSKKKTTRIIAPTNLLVEQSVERYPNHAMWRKSAYTCNEMAGNCAETPVEYRCDKCPYREALAKTRDAQTAVMNFFVYMAHGFFAETIIADEAHNLIDMLEGLSNIKLLHSKYKFPLDMKTAADVVQWAQTRLKDDPEDERLEQIVDNLSRVRDSATVHYETETIRGSKQKVLYVRGNPLTIAKWLLFPRQHVKKIVLLSATLNPEDIRGMGLEHKRTLYIEAPSPIPAANRPFVFESKCNLSYKYQDKALPLLLKCIEATLDKHPNQKGMVHLPYALAARLQEITKHPRLMFHDNRNKKQVLEKFKEAPAESGAVLVASGLYEGISMDEDLARFQIIGKVPFLSLGDPLVKTRSVERPDWYKWECIKRIIQATGRIVRSTTDHGTTYIFDSNFKRLYDDDLRRKPPMFPQFFRAAVKIIK